MTTHPRAVFIDTSVVLNVVDVPGFNQNRAAVADQHREFVAAGVPMLLPLVAVVETGNHIAQSKGDRHRSASTFAELLRKVAAGIAPWTPNELTWNARLVESLVAGDGDGLVSKLVRGVGAGDALILVERADYCRRLRWPVDSVAIWTLDGGLKSYSRPI